jgi:hypothetical protein
MFLIPFVVSSLALQGVSNHPSIRSYAPAQDERPGYAIE